MYAFAIFFLCTCFSIQAFAVPASPSVSTRTLSPPDAKPKISVNITDHNHVDITSNFRIMVYTETLPSLNNTPSNSTIQPRNVEPVNGQRPMMVCPNSRFVESHCTPEQDTPGSLQSYSITCSHYVEHRDPWSGEFQEARLVHSRRTGHCAPAEICIDNLRSNWMPPLPRLAVCVRKELFDGTMYGPGEGESLQKINRVLEKGGYSGAYMVMSQDDGTTPTEVDAFDLDTWPEIGSKQSQACRDCMNIETGGLDYDINALKAEVRLLSAGTAAAAGVLWLALLAG